MLWYLSLALFLQGGFEKCLAVEKENAIKWRFIKEKKDAVAIDTRSASVKRFAVCANREPLTVYLLISERGKTCFLEN